MPVQSSAPARSLEELSTLLAQFESRLEAVEQRVGMAAPAAPPLLSRQEPRPAPALPVNLADTGSMTVLLGKSFLGLALAYLLRALSENGSLPVAAGVAAGLAYALGWLIWAARTPAAETFAVSLRALTAVLIAVPLLWEALLRFHAISTWTTAGVMVFLPAFGLGISWRKNLTAAAWISSLAGVVGCSAFLLATHDVVPFTCAILGLAIAVEASACLEHYLGERWIVAIVADLAVLVLTTIATRPPEAIFDYAPMGRAEVLALQISLVLIYLASTIVRTLGRGFRIGTFEIAQCVVAFLISASGAISVARSHPAAIATVGAFCSLCGAACYLVSFAFGRNTGEDRNFHTYATFGLVLVLAGTWLLFHGIVLVAIWSVLAILFVVSGIEVGRMTLKLHAGAYLVLATFLSGAANTANARFLGLMPHPEGVGTPAGVWIVAGGALISYLLLLRGAAPAGSSPPYRVASVLLAASALWNLAAVAAVLAAPLCRAMGNPNGAPDFCPTILTAILAALSLAAARAGTVRGRPELRWMAVLLAAVATYKIVFQDLRQAPTFAAVLSLIVYGGALVLLPRTLRRSQTEATAAAADA